MSISDGTARAAQFATVFGAVIYAYGWYFLSVVLSEWFLSPEDVGVDFSFLVVRIAPLLVLVLGPLYLVLFWLGKHRGRLVTLRARAQKAHESEGAEGRSSLRQASEDETAGDLKDAAGWSAGDTIWAIVIYLLAAGALVTAFEWALENVFGVEDGEAFLNDHAWSNLILLVLPAVILYAILLAVEHWEVFRRTPRKLKLGALVEALRALVVLATVAGLLYLPFPSRDTIVDRVGTGESVDIGLPFLSLLRFRQVAVTIGGGDTTQWRCVVLLGVGNGLAVFIDPRDGEVIQVPVEQALMEDNCDDASP